MQMEFPRFVVFQVANSGKYLQYAKEATQMHGFICLAEGGEGVLSPCAKHQVVMAKNKKGWVHIRCCYNNKYWVKESDSSWLIAATTDEPEEDESKQSCTLIPQFFDGKSCTLYHVGAKGVLAGRHYNGSDYYLHAATGVSDQFIIIDWESLVKLPKQIAFKGDNRKYLRARLFMEKYPYALFESNDFGDLTVGNEVFTNPDGSIRIKSNHTGKFWRCGPEDYIRPDAEDSSSNALFLPIKMDNNVVALRNMGNNKFCKRVIEENISYLSANSSTITKEALLEVEELVLSRNFYDVNYDLAHAKIDKKIVIVVAEGYAVNATNEYKMVEVKLSYKDKKSNRWSTHCCLKTGLLKANLEASIPFLGEAEVEFSAEEFAGEYGWGETLETNSTVDAHYVVDVPPQTSMKVIVMATKGYYEVPFSYHQRDILFNGEIVTSRQEDGIYNGINYLNFQYQHVETMAPSGCKFVPSTTSDSDQEPH